MYFSCYQSLQIRLDSRFEGCCYSHEEGKIVVSMSVGKHTERYWKLKFSKSWASEKMYMKFVNKVCKQMWLKKKQ